MYLTGDVGELEELLLPFVRHEYDALVLVILLGLVAQSLGVLDQCLKILALEGAKHGEEVVPARESPLLHFVGEVEGQLGIRHDSIIEAPHCQLVVRWHVHLLQVCHGE